LGGHLELGVIGSKSAHKSLILDELWQDELVLAISVKHRWAKKKAVSKKDLLEEPFILREEGSGTLKIMEHYMGLSESKKADLPKVVARLGSSTAVKEGIKAGLGVSILSARAVRTELKTGILKALRIEGLTMSRAFYLIRDRRRIASPLCQAMIEFLIATAKDHINNSVLS
jgi:DNA-binding transcriptional LysR family regulator